jgi:hypothetical protein
MKIDKHRMSTKSRHIQEVEKVEPRELEGAQKLVGDKPEKRLAWALEFAQKDLAELTAGDLLNDRIRVRAFIHPTERWTAPMPMSSLPGPGDVAMIRVEFANMLQPVKAGEQHGGWIQLMYEVVPFRDGRPMVHLGTMDPVNGATLRFAQLLEEFGHELRRCEDPKCRRWWIGRRNKQFCTIKCLSRVTTERLRGEK